MKSQRNFSRTEAKRVGNVTIILAIFLSLCVLSIIKSHFAPYMKSDEAVVFEEERKESLKMEKEESKETGDAVDSAAIEDEDDEAAAATETETETEKKQAVADLSKPTCYESSRRSDTCEAAGDVRVQGRTQTVYIRPLAQEWKIKPYCRKHDAFALSHVKEWTLKPFPHDSPPPACTRNHSATAMIFSNGGFTGNLFHDYTDVLIPVFISSFGYHAEVQFLVSSLKPCDRRAHRAVRVPGARARQGRDARPHPPGHRPRADDGVHPHQAHREQGLRGARRARLRGRRGARRPRAGRPRARAARLPRRPHRRAGVHRRRRAGHRRLRRDPRRELPVPRRRQDLHPPHRAHRAGREDGHRDHARRLGRPAQVEADQRRPVARRPRAARDLLQLPAPLPRPRHPRRRHRTRRASAAPGRGRGGDRGRLRARPGEHRVRAAPAPLAQPHPSSGWRGRVRAERRGRRVGHRRGLLRRRPVGRRLRGRRLRELPSASPSSPGPWSRGVGRRRGRRGRRGRCRRRLISSTGVSSAPPDERAESRRSTWWPRAERRRRGDLVAVALIVVAAVVGVVLVVRSGDEAATSLQQTATIPSPDTPAVPTALTEAWRAADPAGAIK